MASDSHAFKQRAWVVQTRGRYAGRIGCIDNGREDRAGIKYLVQFGSGGPYEWLRHGSLRQATLEEIAEVNGCRVRDLPEACR